MVRKHCPLIFLNGVYRPKPTEEFSGNYNLIGTTSVYSIVRMVEVVPP